jgi:hypothetical protein
MKTKIGIYSFFFVTVFGRFNYETQRRSHRSPVTLCPGFAIAVEGKLYSASRCSIRVV